MESFKRYYYRLLNLMIAWRARMKSLFNLNFIYWLSLYEEGNLTYAAESTNISFNLASVRILSSFEMSIETYYSLENHIITAWADSGRATICTLYLSKRMLVSHSYLKLFTTLIRKSAVTRLNRSERVFQAALSCPRFWQQLGEAPNCVIEVVNIKEDMQVTDIREKNRLSLLIQSTLILQHCRAKKFGVMSCVRCVAKTTRR